MTTPSVALRYRTGDLNKKDILDAKGFHFLIYMYDTVKIITAAQSYESGRQIAFAIGFQKTLA